MKRKKRHPPGVNTRDRSFTGDRRTVSAKRFAKHRAGVLAALGLDDMKSASVAVSALVTSLVSMLCANDLMALEIEAGHPVPSQDIERLAARIAATSDKLGLRKGAGRATLNKRDRPPLKMSERRRAGGRAPYRLPGKQVDDPLADFDDESAGEPQIHLPQAGGTYEATPVQVYLESLAAKRPPDILFEPTSLLDKVLLTTNRAKVRDGEMRQDFLKRMMGYLAGWDDDRFALLEDDLKTWYNAAVTAYCEGRAVPDPVARIRRRVFVEPGVNLTPSAGSDTEHTEPRIRRVPFIEPDSAVDGGTPKS